MGAVRYPLRQVLRFRRTGRGQLGHLLLLVGYIGGKAFEDNPLKGVVLGIGLALAVTLIVEIVRHRAQEAAPKLKSRLRVSS